MSKQILLLAIGIAVGAAGPALAQQAPKEKPPDSVRLKPILVQELKDTFNGKQGKISVVELVKAPDSGSKPHRHPGPVVGYVLEGELEVAVDDGPVKVYKKGEAWFEPRRALHRVSRNPSKTNPARFLAFMLITTEDKELVLPASAAPADAGVTGKAVAQHTSSEKVPSKVRRKPLVEEELKDTLNGKPAKIMVLELQSAPGNASRPHRHPGPVVGYVLEGELEVAVDDGPVKVYKQGGIWFEPTRALHRVNRNPSETKPARFLAFMLMTTEDKHLVLPAKE